MHHIIADEFHLALYIVALMVSLAILMQTIVQKRTDKVQNLGFILMVLIIIVNSLTETINEFLKPVLLENDYFKVIDDFCHLFYFMTHSLIPAVFLFYVASLTGSLRRRKNWHALLFIVPIVILEIIIATNPFTELIYNHGPRGEFQRNWGEYIIYVLAFIYISIAVFNIFRYWNAITFRNRLSLIGFLGLVFVGLVVQLVYKDIRAELFAEALGMLGIMSSLENEDDRMFIEMGVYNRVGLSVDLDNRINTNERTVVLSLRISEIGTTLRSLGLKNINVLTDEITEYLRSKIQRYYIYCVDSSQYIIMMQDYTEEQRNKWASKLFKKYDPPINSDELIEDILDRFKGTWTVGNNKFSLNVKILKAIIPDDFKTIDEVNFFIDSPVPKKVEKTVLHGEDLNYLLRRTEVENAILQGIEKGHFEVYYQPVYELETKKLYGAEALLRLFDDNLGNLYPDEFIPVIEQMGLIDDVDNMVLRKVCEFIKSGIPKKHEIHSLNVNLSIIQCMQKGFVSRINKIVDEYDIDKHLITFEITESVGADDYDKLGEIITELKSSGYQFAMDDYGTGYSNMQSIFSLDFDVIKIDKSILWAAESSDLGMTILTNSVNMIKQMKKKIVVEGVETESQIKLLEDLHVDYQQGFYFSRPVTKEHFIKDILGEEDA